jgi:hypothetical protein
MSASAIPGYAYGAPALARSPVTLDELALLERALLLGDDDRARLKQAGAILGPRAEAILDVWYGFVGSHPFLLESFVAPGGEPDGRYLAAVRARFGQWILDVCERPHDQAWLDYQHEIGLRHTRAKKNRTDGVSAPAHIRLRYVLALVYPITATIRPFLEESGLPAADVEAMHQAWSKAVLLHATLWAAAYTAPEDF